jgi:hypothetical protein
MGERGSIADVNWSLVEQIEGFVTLDVQLLTWHLLRFHNQIAPIESVLEFGVFKGKYFSVLAGIVKDLDIPVVGVDAFLAAVGAKMSPQEQSVEQERVLEAVSSVAGRTDNVTLLNSFTKDLSDSYLLSIAPGGYSFISADGGHDAEDVETDIGLADRVIADFGIVAVDGVYDAVCPGVAEGLFRYFLKQSPNLEPFATCGSKVFFSRPQSAAEYRAFTRDLASDPNCNLPSARQNVERIRANSEIRWQPRLFGAEIVSFASRS